MECSAKKGGLEVIGEEGLFGQVVDKVRSVPVLGGEEGADRVLGQILDTPSLYTKPAIGFGRHGGPPGTYPGTVSLDEGSGVGGWCSC